MIKWANSNAYSVIDVRIYYASGAVHRGNINSNVWEIAPVDGVQVIILIYDRTYTQWVGDKKNTRHYREVISGCDWYWFDPTSKAFGVADSLSEVPLGALVKAGTTCEDFFSIYNSALLETE